MSVHLTSVNLPTQVTEPEARVVNDSYENIANINTNPIFIFKSIVDTNTDT